MKPFFFELISIADEAIDLSALGTSDFTPYVFDRNPLWILLPVTVLLFVVLHLQKPKRPRVTQEHKDTPQWGP